jgi:alpha-beta hydrolase superfamily lysophospholipase
MNHISKSFALGDGRSCKSHYWELREGGYRRVALLLGNGLRPAEKETRMISFLLERGFRVVSLDIAFGSAEGPRIALRTFRDAVTAFAKGSADPGLPFYVLASSFSAGAILPIASSIPGLAAMALFAPVVDFPQPRFKKTCFLMPFVELEVKSEDLCGEASLAEALVSEGLVKARSTLRFRKRDLHTLGAELATVLTRTPAIPVGIFTGEDDPFVAREGRSAFARSKARVYSYPRVRHEPGRDRYADNFYADLGAFLGEVESGPKRQG